MKTAVLMSGQMRTFARCLPSLHWCVFRKLDEPGFFVSCADDEDAASADLLKAKYPNAIVEIERVKQPDLPEPPAHLAAHAPYEISSPIQAILKQLWHLSRVWKFYERRTAEMADEGRRLEFGEEPVTFFRCRPDLHFHRFEKPLGPIEARMAITPWWGNYGGINDRFGMFGRSAAKAFFETYDRLPALLDAGCPVHPESLVCAALELSGCAFTRALCADFGALRKTGEFIYMRPTMQEIAEYAAILSR